VVFDRYAYGPVAGLYDELARLYSRGRIGLTKELSLEFVNPGDRVLYPGVGRGAEALEAARKGALVTGVDLSPEMLARFRAGLDREGLDARLIEADVSRHRPSEPYDVVVANYFLNLFDAVAARAMLEILGRSLRPGGLLVITDFARPQGAAPGRWATELHYRPVNWIAWILGLCALHPILDYPTLLLEVGGFRVVSQRRLPVCFGDNPAYLLLAAERLAV
jgi:demethylmenaquinone methyltransferase/2-methoxy-6-polyprenyl-1,4-benzoquinol methylase